METTENDEYLASLSSVIGGKRPPCKILVKKDDGTTMDVYISRLSASQFDAYQEEGRKVDATTRRANMLSHAIVRPNGDRIYTTPSQLLVLKDMDLFVAEQILDAWIASNGITPKS